jgi:hypothetical protein
MPSDSQSPSNDQLHTVLTDGTRPFHYRSGVHMLLGMPDSETAIAISAMDTPPLEFNYAAPHGMAAAYGPDQSLADELLRLTPEGMRPEPAMPHAQETQQFIDEKPEPDQQTRTSQITDPIRRGAADAVTPAAAEIIAPAEPLSGSGAIDRQASITIPASAERRARTPVRAPSNQVQPQPNEMHLGTQAAAAPTPSGSPEAGRPASSASMPAAGVRPGEPGDPSHRSQSRPAEQLRHATSGPDADLAADPAQAYAPEAGRSTTPPPAPATDIQPGINSSGSAEPAYQGSSGTGERSRHVFSDPAIHIAAGSAVAGDHEGGLPAVSTPMSAVSVRQSAGRGGGIPAARYAVEHAEQLGQTARDPTISSAAAPLPAGGSEISSANPIESFRPNGSTLAAPIAVAPAPAASFAAGIPVAAAPIPAADAPGVGSPASVYQPARGTAEQIAQLQRTVSDLAAQVAAQQVEQRSDQVLPPAAQPVVIVERATPPARMVPAFWERSYLSRLYRWPRR